MTREQIEQALESVQKVLEIISTDEGWRAIADTESAHPDLPSDMGDTLHYLGELITKLYAQS